MLALAITPIFAGIAQGDVHPVAPQLQSRPGAAYTLYLNFGGFNFTGNWGALPGWFGDGTPGSTPAYTTDADPNSFSATELTNIQTIWARAAEKFAPFNINVTTVDPAVAAGQANTDFNRQAFYDNSARMMHTVMGGFGSWFGAGGVSQLGTAEFSYSEYTAGGQFPQNSGAGSGFHTNWVFSGLGPSDLVWNAEVSAHENGHGLGLFHQSDYIGNTLIDEYSSNNGATGTGSYAPIMGDSTFAQRGTWRIGNAYAGGFGPTVQNDAQVILSNDGMGGFIDDGIGHSLATATPLPIVDGSVDPFAARGVIVPLDSINPQAIGVANYTADYFSFVSPGGTVSLTSLSGSDRIAPGVADPGPTVRTVLQILNSSGALVATAPFGQLQTTITRSLPAGKYYARVSNGGGFTSMFGGLSQYFDMGSFFIYGDGVAASQVYWSNTAGGAWSVLSNWQGQSVPIAFQDVHFNLESSLGYTTSIDAPAIAENLYAFNDRVTLSLNGAAASLTANSIQLGGAGVGIPGGIGAASLVISSGSSVSVAQSLRVLNADSRVTFSSGALSVKSLQLMSGGQVVLTPGANKVLQVRELTIDASSQVDLSDNAMIVDYAAISPADSIRSLLQAGRASGAWTGNGITTSLGDAANFALGFTDDGDKITIDFTRYGDANLDNIVNVSDFTLLAGNFGLTGRFWYQGDFNYDAFVNVTDFTLLANNFNLSATGTDGRVTPQDWANLAAAVPEPGNLLVAGGFIVGGLLRPRRVVKRFNSSSRSALADPIANRSDTSRQASQLLHSLGRATPKQAENPLTTSRISLL